MSSGPPPVTPDMSSSAHPLAPADRDAFAALAEPHRRELQVHCYRMLASFDEAQDLVQETFLRAWRKRASFAGRSTFRAWLYGIATNACLDAIARRSRTFAVAPDAEITWLEPYPDALLDAAPGPDEAVIAKETVELAYLVAIQHMTAQSRAVLILRDVVGLPARETADVLESACPPSTARSSGRGRCSPSSSPPSGRSGRRARTPRRPSRRCSSATCARRRSSTSRRSSRRSPMRSGFSMPPEEGACRGRETVVGMWVDGGFGTDEWAMRCLVTRVNRQPAVACYVLRDGAWRPFRSTCCASRAARSPRSWPSPSRSPPATACRRCSRDPRPRRPPRVDRPRRHRAALPRSTRWT